MPGKTHRFACNSHTACTRFAVVSNNTAKFTGLGWRGWGEKKTLVTPGLPEFPLVQGYTVWCKAILFVLPSNYEIQKAQIPMLHMDLGFASKLALDSHKHLVYRQHTFLSQKLSWCYNIHQHNHTAVSEASNTNETANFATQLWYFFITARKPSLLSNKSMDKKHVT